MTSPIYHRNQLRVGTCFADAFSTLIDTQNHTQWSKGWKGAVLEHVDPIHTTYIKWPPVAECGRTKDFSFRKAALAYFADQEAMSNESEVPK